MHNTIRHPMLKPALRRGWRDLRTAQFGVTPAHAIVLGPLDTATARLLHLLDGTRGLPLLREEASRMGLADGQVDQLLARLVAAGLLDDATGGGEAAQALRERGGPALDRLRPDLAALSMVSREPGGALGRLAARRTTRVQVRGLGRVGAAVAAMLAGAGVGGVDVRDGGCVEPWDVAPGGLPPESVGGRREEAARRLVRRCAPGRLPRLIRPGRSASAPGPGPGRQPRTEPGFSLVVLAPREGLDGYAPDPAAAEHLMAAGTPHLYAGVIEGTGVVGPLVLPGASACANCLELGRAERDPDWPRLVAQWRSGPSRPVPSGELALSTAVAGLVAGHALAFLDGESPASTGARWEASLPDLAWSVRRVEAHPDCRCGASGGGEGGSHDVREQHETMAG
ncbi:ThiF family adenylyltransferase [Streptomyces apocyni]|uniref:ThiF family adenylyltransferase n=1 Tax=Streptomyces apocyni TaxID=2654677 RepID=UPI0012EA687D|nr:ThiF family adenylyltransferase [Streptomyces apocyni]